MRVFATRKCMSEYSHVFACDMRAIRECILVAREGYVLYVCTYHAMHK